MVCTGCRHRPLHCSTGLSRWLLIGALFASLGAEGVSVLASPDFGPECSQDGGTGCGASPAGEGDFDFSEYLATCRELQILPSGDAIIRLQAGAPNLTIRPSAGRPFGDLELTALVSLLESKNATPLQSLSVLDLSACSLSPSGIILIARLLQNPRCSLESLDFSNQPVNLWGLRRLVAAANSTRSLRSLRMHSCNLGDDGALELEPLLQSRVEGMLEELDIQNNFIGSKVCQLLDDAAHLSGVTLRLEGNRVFGNVLNSVSHGVGFLLALVGTWFMVKRVAGKPRYYLASVVVYCLSLLAMYLSSTLYHAFFATGDTLLRIFNIFDYAGIFLLIAGTFTPFLGIVFHGECWASAFLYFMWGTAAVGILVLAFYTGPGAQQLRLVMFLGMGWSAVMVIMPLWRALGRGGVVWLLGGGVLYTLGVPWFVAGEGGVLGIPYHTIWHCWVVAASAAHYLCIYWYVADLPEKTAIGSPQELEEMDAPQSSRNLETGFLPA